MFCDKYCTPTGFGLPVYATFGRKSASLRRRLRRSANFQTRSKCIRGVLLVMLATGFISATFAAEPGQPLSSTNIVGARIRFDAETNQFGELMAGEPVKHVFIFTNLGSQDLIISRVQPGCGCTTAGDWTHLTRPGEAGLVPIQLRTAGLRGSVDKEVTVTCNDPTRPVVSLKLKGKVRKAMDISPSLAILNPQPDSPFEVATLRITNCLGLPLLLSSPESTNSALGVELRTNVFGQDYSVIISNTLPLPPGAQVSIIPIKTSLTNLPVIHLTTMAIVSQTFTVEPSQISLRSAPLSSNQVAYVMILNNSTNPVSFSEPRVSGGGVQISIKEKKPGAAFTAVLSFPAGFKLLSGQSNYLSLRTSNPWFPMVQVPIFEVSNAVPVAPFLSNAGIEMATARLPLVYQTEAVDGLKLSGEQLEEIDGLKKEFIEEIGGLGQDPGDPAYLARWQNARRKVDAMLETMIGQTALERFETSADSAGANSK